MTSTRAPGSTFATKASRIRAKLDLLAIAAKTNTAVWRSVTSTQEERQDSLAALVYAAKQYADAESGRDRVDAALVQSDTRPTKCANDSTHGRR